MKNILKIFEQKGWSLYRVTQDLSGNLERIIQQGKASEILVGNYYHILPLAKDHKNLNQVLGHLEMASKTDQKPYYNGGKDNRFVLDGIEFQSDSAFFHLTHTTDFRVNVPYKNLDSTIKKGISNYNIYYFDSIDSLIRVVGQNPQQPSQLPDQLRWELTHKENSEEMILWPSNQSPILFRGQNNRHIPCFPTTARGIPESSRSLMDLSPEDRAKIIVNLIKTDWFCEVLKETPQYKWLAENKIFMDRMALAQHYELPTGLIDLSQSLEVSSFFACCKYSEGKWKAMDEGDGEEKREGIIYALDYRSLPFEDLRVKPIGQQVFPRPSEQWGWVYEMNLGDDFDSLPYVKKFVFKHDLEASQRILKKFNYGKSLFPNDPLSAIAISIKDSEKLPERNAKYVIDDLISDDYGFPSSSYEEIVDLILDHGKHIIESEPIQILTNELINELEGTWNSRKDNFINNCGVRLVRTKREKS